MGSCPIGSVLRPLTHFTKAASWIPASSLCHYKSQKLFTPSTSGNLIFWMKLGQWLVERCVLLSTFILCFSPFQGWKRLTRWDLTVIPGNQLKWWEEDPLCPPKPQPIPPEYMNKMYKLKIMQPPTSRAFTPKMRSVRDSMDLTITFCGRHSNTLVIGSSAKQ